MDKRAIKTSKGARAIIEDNIQIIYHLPGKYKQLIKALEPIRKELLQILQFCKDTEPIIWNNKYVWFLDNKRLTRKVRKKTTEPTSSRHFNYLCCIGALNKLKQTEERMTGVNMTFLLNERENGKIRPINTFTVHRYTDKELDRMNARAAELLEHGITPGNISKDKLAASGCIELAKEVYYANSENSLQNKEKEFKRVLENLEKLIGEKGYTTKKEVCSNLDLNRERLDQLLNIFKSTWQQYTYKAPNKEEKEVFKLQKDYKEWIIYKGDYEEWQKERKPQERNRA